MFLTNDSTDLNFMHYGKKNNLFQHGSKKYQ